MKKLLIFSVLILSSFGYAQAEYEKISITENLESVTATKINVQESDGQINYVDSENIPINQPPHPINYTAPTATLGGHLIGIDDALNANQTNANSRLPKSYASNYDVADVNYTISGTTFDAFGFLVQTLSNKIITIYREGTSHVSDDGKIVMRSSTDGGKTFSSRAIIHEQSGVDCRNIAGGVTPSGRIIIFFLKATNAGPTFISQGTMYSDDDGVTWSAYTTQSVPVGNNGFSPYGNMITTDNGRLAMPYYAVLSDGNNATYLKFSDDNGNTWGSEITVASDPTNGYNEASYAYLDGGVILCVVRRQDQLLLRQFISIDNGQTWTNQGDITSSNAQNVAPWLNVYTESNGEKYVALFSSLRGVGAGINGVVASKSSLITNGSTAWIAETRQLITSNINADSGYPSVINPRGGRKMLGVSYASVSGSVANLKVWNYTPTAVTPAMTSSTINYIQKKSSYGNLGDSQLFDNGSNFLGFGATNPLTTPSGKAFTVASDTVNGAGVLELLGNTSTDSTPTGIIYFGVNGSGAVSGSFSARRVGGNNTFSDMVIDIRGAGGYRSNAMRWFSTGGVAIGGASDLGNGTLNVASNISTIAGTTANHAVIKSQLDLKADLASPVFTGNPTAPTAAPGDNDLTIANTAFVNGVATSASYSPTLTTVGNIDALSLLNASYTKIGNIVSVSATISIDATTINNLTQLTIALPFNRTNSTDLHIGSGSTYSASVSSISGVHLFSDATNTVRLVTYAPIAVSAFIATVKFQYSTLN